MYHWFLYWEIFCKFYEFSFLSLHSLHFYNHDSWTGSTRFFTHHRNRQRNTFCPHTWGESAITIACFIDGKHWVGVVLCKLNSQVYFLYSEDLNNPQTEWNVKQLLSHTNQEFYLLSTIWINCKAFTYSPHSNECGPRTLLAISIWCYIQNHHRIFSCQ